MSEFMMPQMANNLGHVFGGAIMSLMDRCAAVAAMRHSGRPSVTVAVDSMKRGVDRVAVGVVEAERAGETIGEVQQHARRVMDAVSEITVALREQAAASTEIAQNVERIAQMAEENNAAAGSNAHTADGLRQLAETLNQEVGRFRT